MKERNKVKFNWMYKVVLACILVILLLPMKSVPVFAGANLNPTQPNNVYVSVQPYSTTEDYFRGNVGELLTVCFEIDKQIESEGCSEIILNKYAWAEGNKPVDNADYSSWVDASTPLPKGLEFKKIDNRDSSNGGLYSCFEIQGSPMEESSDPLPKINIPKEYIRYTVDGGEEWYPATEDVQLDFSICGSWSITESTIDYALYLGEDGVIRKNNSSGDVATVRGISYSDGKYIFTDVEFTTKATIGMISYDDLTIVLSGSNNITSGSGSSSCWGITVGNKSLTLEGDGSLVVWSGNNDSSSGVSCGISCSNLYVIGCDVYSFSGRSAAYSRGVQMIGECAISDGGYLEARSLNSIACDHTEGLYANNVNIYDGGIFARSGGGEAKNGHNGTFIIGDLYVGDGSLLSTGGMTSEITNFNALYMYSSTASMTIDGNGLVTAYGNIWGNNPQVFDTVKYINGVIESNCPGCIVKNAQADAIILKKGEVSDTWTYTASGLELTASCNGECGQAGAHEVSVTLTPVSPTYSGSDMDLGWICDSEHPVEFALSNKESWIELLGEDSLPVIKYVGTGSTEYSESADVPTETGTYKAKITKGSATVEREFIIKTNLDYTHGDPDIALIRIGTGFDSNSLYWLDTEEYSCFHQNSDGTYTLNNIKEGANAILEKANTGAKDYILTLNNLRILGSNPSPEGLYAAGGLIPTVIEDLYDYTYYECASRIDNLKVVVNGNNQLGKLSDPDRFLEKEYYSAIRGIEIGGNIELVGEGTLSIFDSREGIGAKNITINGGRDFKLNITDCGESQVMCCLLAEEDIIINSGTCTLLNGISSCLHSMSGIIHITGGKLDATTYSGRHYGSAVFFVQDGKLIVDGGEITAKNLAEDEACEVVLATGDVIINGGTFNVSTNKVIADGHMSIGFDVTRGTLCVNGGKINVTAGIPILINGEFDGTPAITIAGGDIALTTYSNADVTVGGIVCNNSTTSDKVLKYINGKLSFNHDSVSSKHYDIILKEKKDNGIYLDKALNTSLKIALGGLDGRLDVTYPFPVVTYKEDVNPEFDKYSFISFEAGKKYSKILGGTVENTVPNKIYIGEGFYKESYTVKFDANGGIGSMADEVFEIDVDEKELSANTFTKSGYVFAGWSTHRRSEEPTYTNRQKVYNLSETDGDVVTLYAVWKERGNVFDITVTINSNYPDSVDVKLVKGNTQYAVRSDIEMSGSLPYSATETFNDMQPGTYNVVATQKVSSLGDKEITVTEAVVVTDSDKSVDLELPSSDTNSVLKITPGRTPDIVVGGLSDEADDAAADNVGKAVEILMTVEEKDEAAATGSADIKNVASEGEQLKYFDFDIEKTVWTLTGGNRSTTPDSRDSVHNTSNVLTMLVPYSMAGKETRNIKVYRCHDDGVNTKITEAFSRYNSLPATPADGHYYVDAANSMVYIYANKFSTYAIGYKASSEIIPPVLTPTIYADSVKILDPGKYVLTEKNEQLQLTAVILPDYTDNKTLYWKSSDEKILSVDGNGMVTAGEEGEVVITVTTVNGKSDSIGLAVKYKEDEKKPEDEEPKDEKKPEDEEPKDKKPEITPEIVAENTIAINEGLKVSQTGSKINVEWGKVAKADGYLVYATYCGTTFEDKPLKTVKDPDVTKVTITKLNGKPLDLKEDYKLYIKAYKLVDGKKVAFGKSITAHVVGVENKKNTNVKSIKLKSKGTLSLKVGKTSEIKAEVVLVDPTRKQLSDAHAAEFRYASSNKKVATVDKSGVIKAKSKGTCYIYVYAKNGYAKKVKVTVK